MAEKVQLAAKTSKTKENSASTTRKIESPQSISSPADQVLHLQRTIGNQAVQRLIKSGALQAKLKIGQPGDKYEQEADRVADAVMRMPQAVSSETPYIQRACPTCGGEELQRQPIEEEEEELQRQPIEEEKEELQRQPIEEEKEELQRQPIEEEEEELQRQPIEEEEELQAKPESGHISDVNPHLESQIQSLKGGGRPLSANEGSFFEPRFGRDFSQVRMHTDTKAAEAAQAVNAQAFTMGHNMVFGAGQYTPGTSEGQRLLAHELKHVVQQSGKSIYPTIQRTSTISHVPYSIQRNNQITEENLPSPTERRLTRSEREYRTFMREVYRRQIAIWLAQGATYVHEVVATERVELPASYALPGRRISVKQILENSTLSMIDDARAALRTTNAPGGPAADVDNIAIRSGYRPAMEQFRIWTRWAPDYYLRTRDERQALPGGEHGPAAAQHLAEYTNERVFSPGYSPHQRAEAIDLSYHYRPGRAPQGTENGWAPASSEQTWIMTWRRSWLFHWLWENAPNYGFVPNPNINEPWHWEFSPTALVLSFLRWLLPILDRLLETRWSAGFEEQFARGRGPIGPEDGPAEGEAP